MKSILMGLASVLVTCGMVADGGAASRNPFKSTPRKVASDQARTVPVKASPMKSDRVVIVLADARTLQVHYRRALARVDGKNPFAEAIRSQIARAHGHCTMLMKNAAAWRDFVIAGEPARSKKAWAEYNRKVAQYLKNFNEEVDAVHKDFASK